MRVQCAFPLRNTFLFCFELFTNRSWCFFGRSLPPSPPPPFHDDRSECIQLFSFICVGFPSLSFSDAGPLQHSMQEITHSYLHLFANDVLYISVFMPHAFRGQRKCFDVCFFLLFYCRYYALAESQARCDRKKCAQTRDAQRFLPSSYVCLCWCHESSGLQCHFFPPFYASSISVCNSNGFRGMRQTKQSTSASALTEFRLA